MRRRMPAPIRAGIHSWGLPKSRQFIFVRIQCTPSRRTQVSGGPCDGEDQQKRKSLIRKIAIIASLSRQYCDYPFFLVAALANERSQFGVTQRLETASIESS